MGMFFAVPGWKRMGYAKMFGMCREIYSMTEKRDLERSKNPGVIGYPEKDQEEKRDQIS